jgi:hypothetical protein
VAGPLPNPKKNGCGDLEKPVRVFYIFKWQIGKNSNNAVYCPIKFPETKKTNISHREHILLMPFWLEPTSNT